MHASLMGFAEIRLVCGAASNYGQWWVKVQPYNTTAMNNTLLQNKGRVGGTVSSNQMHTTQLQHIPKQNQQAVQHSNIVEPSAINKN
jgi:hypothetical protein